jgi:glutathione S-transferase
MAPAVIAIERRMNDADDGAARADLRALPGHLDRIDGWIAAGVLTADAERPNAADLQIGASLRLLSTMADLRPLLAGRPADRLATALFPEFPGEVPAGAFPPAWLPEAAA